MRERIRLQGSERAREREDEIARERVCVRMSCKGVSERERVIERRRDCKGDERHSRTNRPVLPLEEGKQEVAVEPARVGQHLQHAVSTIHT